jgi:hypothetical protein
MTDLDAAVAAAVEACPFVSDRALVRRIVEATAPVLEAAARERARADRIVSAIFACRSGDCPQPFALYRQQDVSGVSGGPVAHGVQLADGEVVIRWLGTSPSTVVWDSLDDAMKVHGHDGKTQVVWLAAPFSEMGKAEEEAAAAERERLAADLAARADEAEATVMPNGRDGHLFVAGLRRAVDLIRNGDQPAEPAP